MSDSMEDRITALEEALQWYAEQARLARLIHKEGDAGRHALADDGGNRARAALAASQPVAVKVKPLVWEEKLTHGRNAKLLVAESPIGEFCIEYGSWQNGKLLLGTPKSAEWLPVDVEAAKQRAQQELDAEIMPWVAATRAPVTVRDAAIAELRELIAGYEHWASDVKRLTRALDVELHGDDAAPQASLCDLVGSIKAFKEKSRASTVQDAVKVPEIVALIKKAEALSAQASHVGLGAAVKGLDITDAARELSLLSAEVSAALRAIAEGRA